MACRAEGARTVDAVQRRKDVQLIRALDLLNRGRARLHIVAREPALPFALASLMSAAGTLAAVAVLTRMLSADNYGQYAATLAAVALLHTSCFYWLQTSITRFHSRARTVAEAASLAGTLRVGFLITLVFAIAGWLALSTFNPTSSLPTSLAGLALLLTRGWLCLRQAWTRAHSKPWRFALIEGLQSIGSILAAIALLRIVPDDPAPVLWAGTGMALVGILLSIDVVERAKGHARPSWTVLRELWSYGGPLLMVASISAVIAVSDRLLIAHLLGSAAAGIYNVGYAVADRAIGLLLLPIAVAIKPAIFTAFENEGNGPTRDLMADLAVRLMAVGLPATIFVAYAAEPLLHLVAPAHLAKQAAPVVPWVAAGTLLAALLNLHFSLAFQLSRRTLAMVAATAPAALANVIANWLLLEPFGIVAAGWSTAGSYALALGLAVLIGRGHFAVPFPFHRILKVASASAALAVFLQLSFSSNPIALPFLAAGGAFVYGAALWLLHSSRHRETWLATHKGASLPDERIR